MTDLLKNQIRMQYFDEKGSVADKTFDFLGDDQHKLKVTCWASAVTPVVLSIDKDTLQCLVLVCTKAVTIYTNADTPGQSDTIVLEANVPKLWAGSPAIGGTNPFNTADVTALYVHNASGVQAVLTIVALTNATPVAS